MPGTIDLTNTPFSENVIMRKFSFGFGLACCVAAAAMLGGCSKNEGCCGSCKDKANVKMEATAAPAGKSCADKASCADKSSCAKSCGAKKSCGAAQN